MAFDAALVAEIKALLLKRAADPNHHAAVLKWDRNQPRGPKGSRQGGRWVKDVSAGEGTLPSTSTGSAPFTPPEYGFGSTEDRRMSADNRLRAAFSGEGFTNPPHGEGMPLAPRGTSMAVAKVATVLAEGTVTGSKGLGSKGGANSSVVITLDDGTKALYKPEAGENWGDEGEFVNGDISRFITNRDFSLAAREAFAFEVGHAVFGDDNPVPVTIQRDHMDNDNLSGLDVTNQGGEDYGGGGYDSDEARARYDSYREGAMEHAYEVAGEEMSRLYQEAARERADDIEKRAEEVAEILDGLVKDQPENPAGSASVLRGHPVLPLGSQQFERNEPEELDPMDILEEAGITKTDVEYSLNDREKAKVSAILSKRLEAGPITIGSVDRTRAEEHLEWDDFIENHSDTEAKLIDNEIQSFTQWRQSQGYNSSNSGGGGGEEGGVRNPQAPHPDGGSLQHFRTDTKDDGYMSHEDSVRMSVFDYVIGSMDRHHNNVLFTKGTDRVVAIDNGYSMPGSRHADKFQFRSVAVDEFLSGDGKVSPQQRQEILAGLTETNWEALVARHPGMSPYERQGLLDRIERAKEALATENGLKRLWRSLDLM